MGFFDQYDWDSIDTDRGLPAGSGRTLILSETRIRSGQDDETKKRAVILVKDKATGKSQEIFITTLPNDDTTEDKVLVAIENVKRWTEDLEISPDKARLWGAAVIDGGNPENLNLLNGTEFLGDVVKKEKDGYKNTYIQKIERLYSGGPGGVAAEGATGSPAAADTPFDF